MFRRCVAAVTTAAAVAIPMPPAMADAPLVDCRLSAPTFDPVTGSSFGGQLVGVIVHFDVSTVWIRCRVTVDNVTVDSTPVGSGITFAFTSKQSSPEGYSTGVVRVCADYYSNHGSGTWCKISD